MEQNISASFHTHIHIHTRTLAGTLAGTHAHTHTHKHTQVHTLPYCIKPSRTVGELGGGGETENISYIYKLLPHKVLRGLFQITTNMVYVMPYLSLSPKHNHGPTHT